MKCEPTILPGVVVLTPRIFPDDRGFFLETYNDLKYAEFGIKNPFVQDNLSRSCKGTLRGLHYQLPHTQGKLVSVIRGEVFDVAVDIRRGSDTFGQWTGHLLSEDNHAQLWIPAGFAHGFCVLSDEADFLYKCTDHYAPNCDHGILWNDPEIGIEWPIEAPLLSDKDARQPRLKDVPEADLPSCRIGA